MGEKCKPQIPSSVSCHNLSYFQLPELYGRSDKFFCREIPRVLEFQKKLLERKLDRIRGDTLLSFDTIFKQNLTLENMLTTL
jgi:hypothetical protein